VQKLLRLPSPRLPMQGCGHEPGCNHADDPTATAGPTTGTARSNRPDVGQQRVARGRSPHQVHCQKADSQVEQPASRLSRQAVDGQLLTFAAGCMQAWSRGRWPGARSPAHARGAPFSVRRRRAINTVCSCDGRGHRESGLRPCPKPPARAPGWQAQAGHTTPDASGRWWCPRAQAPFAVAPQICRALRC